MVRKITNNYIKSIKFASQLITIFIAEGTAVYAIAENGFKLFSTSFLFAGINIFASALFTALSNGKVSAILSLMRTFVFIVLSLLTFPIWFSVTGIWLAIPFAEIMTIILSVWYLIKRREDYGYLSLR